MGHILHISSDEIEIQAEKILKPIKYGESAVGVCYPGCFIDYNLSSFLTNSKITRRYLGKFYKKNLFFVINLTAEETMETFMVKVYDESLVSKLKIPQGLNFNQFCRRIMDNGKDPYFFLLNAHLLTPTNLQQILNPVHVTIIKTNRIGIQIYFETNIWKPEIKKILEYNHKLSQNTLFFPAYSRKESLRFIQNSANLWKIKISPKLASEIVDKCGGYLWLIREATRYFRDHKPVKIEKIISKSQVVERAKYIFSLLSQEEKEILLNLSAHSQNKIDLNSAKYLITMQIISKNKDHFTINFPLINLLVEEYQSSRILKINTSKQVIFNDKNIERYFGTSELKTLQILLQNQGKITTRDTIAQTIWGNNYLENYSDWAIDKMISRIRITLRKLGIVQNLIITKKRQGFIIL